MPRSIRIRVKPNARVARLDPLDDGTWVARVRALPVDGRANEELIELVARHFGVRRSSFRIRSGASGRLKRVDIDD